eukprot:4803914-Alexandrium_andersonii.AAC.1
MRMYLGARDAAVWALRRPLGPCCPVRGALAGDQEKLEARAVEIEAARAMPGWRRAAAEGDVEALWHS